MTVVWAFILTEARSKVLIIRVEGNSLFILCTLHSRSSRPITGYASSLPRTLIPTYHLSTLWTPRMFITFKFSSALKIHFTLALPFQSQVDMLLVFPALLFQRITSQHFEVPESFITFKFSSFCSSRFIFPLGLFHHVYNLQSFYDLDFSFSLFTYPNFLILCSEYTSQC